MNIYSINTPIAKFVEKRVFKLEKDLQKIVEKNLSVFFELEFVATEFSLEGQYKEMRIDSLAFDPENKAFVIIEYKRNKNSSVIDQGYSYLSAMLNNKAKFVLALRDINKKYNLYKERDINWENSRIFFIAPEFTPTQKESVSFKDLPISLWEINAFKNNTISIEKIGVSTSIAQIKQISKHNSKQIISYTEKGLLSKSEQYIKEVYEHLKEDLLDIENLELKITKIYISFTYKGKNIVDIEPFKKSLKLFFNAKFGYIKGYDNLLRNVSNVGHHGNGDYQMTISDYSNKSDEIIDIVKQLLKLQK